LGLYFSRRDRRAFVPKRSGLGATVNFARGAGVGFLVGVLGFVVLLLALTRQHGAGTASERSRSRVRASVA
jgi:uncharacterized membrane protein